MSDRLLRLPASIIGKLCGFSRGQFRSCPRATSTSSPRSERRSEMQMRIALFPCVRVMAHYAHVGFLPQRILASATRLCTHHVRRATKSVLSESFAKRTLLTLGTLIFRLSTIPIDLCARTAPFLTRTFAFPDSFWFTASCYATLVS